MPSVKAVDYIFQTLHELIDGRNSLSKEECQSKLLLPFPTLRWPKPKVKTSTTIHTFTPNLPIQEGSDAFPEGLYVLYRLVIITDTKIINDKGAKEVD